MKRLLLAVILALSLGALAQAPIQRNAMTTNSPGRVPNTLATSANAIYPLLIEIPDGSGSDRPLKHNANFSIQDTNANLTGILRAGGGAFTNTLTLNGVPVLTNASGGGGVTNIFDTTITTNNFFLSGKGNTLVITQVVQFAWTTLTMTGSNVSSLNLTNGTFYKLTLTNDAFMVAPINFPGTNFGATYQVHIIQDGTGGRSLTATNSSFVINGSGTSTNAVLPISTNANAVSVLTLVSSPFNSTKLYGTVVTTP